MMLVVMMRAQRQKVFMLKRHLQGGGVLARRLPQRSWCSSSCSVNRCSVRRWGSQGGSAGRYKALTKLEQGRGDRGCKVLVKEQGGNRNRGPKGHGLLSRKQERWRPWGNTMGLHHLNGCPLPELESKQAF